MDQATFAVEEADEYRMGQTVFACLNGLAMAGTVGRVGPHGGTVTVAWKQDAGTRGKVEQAQRLVDRGRFNGARMAA
ncbi:hypothetical protein [Azospirillum brasilense]|uniref:Uncharacterized protein n=1 Tax=Azospirillum brasilense TaxID=192 RepID=A0A235H480_AZOBR|nr:hypothetical protein [Azospirillum brasilense]OYD80224.1 hypothetical protein CHT98_32400 [Azospirillum brasilense]